MKSDVAWIVVGLAAGCGGGSDGDEPSEACAPFSVEVPFRVTSALSIGGDWALATTVLSNTTMIVDALDNWVGSPGTLYDDAQAGYARVDRTGTVSVAKPALDGLYGLSPRPFAWTGSTLAYLWASSTETHVRTMTPDAEPVLDGAELGLQFRSPTGELLPPSSGLVVATVTGFDIAACSHTVLPVGSFVSTNAQGVPSEASPRSLGSSLSFPTAIETVGGKTVAAWFRHLSPGLRDAAIVGVMPEASNKYANGPGVANLGADQLQASNAAAASSGAELIVLARDPSKTVAFDGTQATPVPLQVDARAVAWAGDHYELAAVGNDNELVQVRMAPDHAVGEMTPVPGAAAGTLIDAVVAADASRALFGRFYTDDGGANHQVLTQVCL